MVSVCADVTVHMMPLLFFYKKKVHERCLQSENGSARLMGFNSSFVGFLQVCDNGHWIPITSKDEQEWTQKNSIVVCRELGFHGALRMFSQDG